MSTRHLIYALIDSTSEQIRYVGRSSSGLKRPRIHWTRDVGRNDYCHNWVRSLTVRGIIPEILVLEEFEPTIDVSDRLNDAEDFWIQYLRSIGCRLTNLRRGGLNGTHSEETKRKIGEKSRLIPREVRSAAMKGKNIGPRPQWVREKLSLVRKGLKLSEEAKESRRKKYDRRGQGNPMYGRRRFGEENPFFGKKHSPETIEKIKATKRKKRGQPPKDSAAQ